MRRFGFAALAGSAVTIVPYLWVLFDLWRDSPSLLRTAKLNGFASNFYDLQARAMFAGHLSVANDSLGIEGYSHNGRVYTYFGIFPSILRMPVLLITHSLDGRLTAVSMLVAWLIIGLFTSLLLWRVRIMVRGPAVLGRAEAAAFGVLVASVMGGSTLVFLAASPNVYAEDLAWSVVATVGSLFTLCGVLERPSWGRVTASGTLILAASLTRAPTGYACVLGAIFVSVWFASGRGGARNRSWWLPVLVAGLVPFAVGCAVNFAKFGLLVGLPITEGFAFKVLGGPNGGHEFSLRFLPSTLFTYFRPNGLRFTTVFPFITMPDSVATGIWGVSVYGNRTASLTASMPLFFLLAVWGAISSFRPRVVKGLRAIRILLVAAAAGAGAILIFGWIANRYLADFLPFLVLGASVGLVDMWHRLESRSRQLRGLALLAVASLGLFGIAANVGIALTPSDTWSPDQVLHYVQAQKRVSDATGHRMSPARGYQLPNWAPADQLFIVGHCDTLYISDGEGSQTNLNFGFQILGLTVQFGWLPSDRVPSRSLCRSLVPDQHQTKAQIASLTRADRAFTQAGAGFTTWTFKVAVLGRNPPTSELVAPTDALIHTLREYDSTINDLVLSGNAKAAAGTLIADDRSMEDDLSAMPSPTQSAMTSWRTLAKSDWTKVTSATASLLAAT